jgi:dienelactone hydrolase
MRTTGIRSWIFAALVVAPGSLLGQTKANRPWLWGRIEGGRFGVGFRVVVDVDSSRPERGTNAQRPLEIAIWYPTVQSLTREHLRFGAYVDVSDGSMIQGLRGRQADWRRRWLAESISRTPGSIEPALLDRLLGSPMAAVRDATPAPGRRPAVLWSTRHATPAAQSVLSEVLASHGYVVAWVRYAGSDSLVPPFDNITAARKLEILEAHVADLQWTIRQLVANPNVDSTRIALAAWSYSGDPAMVAAQRTPRVRAVVSLSSNVFAPTYRTAHIATSLDSLPLRADVLMFEETGEAMHRPRQAPAVLDRLPGKVYRATFASLAHGNFNVLEGMIPGLTGVKDVQPWAIGGPQARRGYETLTNGVVALLNKMLSGAPGNANQWVTRDVRLTRHGPGRDAASTSDAAFTDDRVEIASGRWRLVGNVVRPTGAGRVATVLLLNKANGDRRVYAHLARELASRGIASLRLDLRGEGESTNIATFVPGLANAALDSAERDVVAALRWLRSRRYVEPGRIGVVGASYSGEAMAIASRLDGPAAAYVALSPGSLSAQTIDAIDTAAVPWWVLRSKNERFVRDVVDALRARSRTARTTEVDGAAHATDMLVVHPELAAEIAEWLRTALDRRS